MIINLGGEDVAVLTAGSVTDPYSQEAAESWSSGVTERTVPTLTPADPRPSDEPLQDARHAVKSGWTLYLPPGDPITAANALPMGTNYLKLELANDTRIYAPQIGGVTLRRE